MVLGGPLVKIDNTDDDDINSNINCNMVIPAKTTHTRGKEVGDRVGAWNQ